MDINHIHSDDEDDLDDKAKLFSNIDDIDNDHHHNSEEENNIKSEGSSTLAPSSSSSPHKDQKKHSHGHSHGKKKKDKHGHGHSHGSRLSIEHSDDEEEGLNGIKKKGFFNMNKKKRARFSLLVALVLTTIFMVGEVVGGYLANSLAIMTDAAHLLTDIGAMCLSLFAMWISDRPPTSSMSFGFHRAEILGALVSVLMIWALTGVLVYEGIQRVIHPPEIVDGKIMFIIATGGLLVNVIDAIILHWGSGGHGHSHGLGGGHSHGGETDKRPKKKRVQFTDDDIEDLDHSNNTGNEKREIENINVHSAYIHVLGDCLQSIGVMIASVLIWIKPSWKIADPVTTFIFSGIVLLTTIRLLRQSLSVLMEAVPHDINPFEVQEDLSEMQGVVEVHDLHIWSITVGKPALSVHLSIGEGIDPDEILCHANQLLADNHSITHTTIQIEKPKGDSQCRDNSCPPPPPHSNTSFTTRNRINSPPNPEH